MTSGGPCQRLSDAYFLIKPTIRPVIKGRIKIKITNSGVLVRKSFKLLKLRSGFLKKFVKYLTKLINP